MKKIISFLLLLVIISVGWISYGKSQEKAATAHSEQTVKPKVEKPTIRKSEVPTLFIHGYSGGPSSFGGMIARFENAGVAKKELRLTVTPAGEVQEAGSLSGQKNNPMIQVLFEDNQNNEWQQTEWIKSCLVYLQEKYGTREVKIVGHSMGGVSTLRYLATYGASSDLPKVQKFAAIGAPFNEFLDTQSGQSIDQLLANGPAERSARYQDYLELAEQIPKETSILLIGGKINQQESGDGTVPLTSALSVARLLMNNGNPVQTQIVTGENAHHSQLHENETVDKWVKKFLWDISE